MEPLVTPAAATISLTDALSYPFSANSRVAAATNRRRTAGSCVRAIRAPSLALAAPGSIPSGRYGGKGYGQRAARHRPAPADRLARRAVPGPAGRATPGTGDRRRPLQPHLRGPPQWTVDGAPPAAAGPRARHRPRHAPRVHGADRARPTPVPVPRTLAYCDGPDVIGAPFYLMEKVPGVIYRDGPALRALDSAAGRALGHALADTLADLHVVDPAAVGLAEFGRPEGFLERQVRRWRKQLAASYTRPLPGAEELAERLAGTEPVSGRAAVVHGDFRLDNVLVDPSGEGRIAAVLDWEMATLGDPLTDLGITCVYWDGLADLNDSTPPSPGSLPGWPSRDELVDRYATRSGTAVGALDWYVAFAYFKLAVILEGIYCRHTQGLTVGEGFDDIGAAVPELFARGHATLG